MAKIDKKNKEYKIKDASNPREVALIVLLNVTEEGKMSHLALPEALSASRLPDRDRAFVKRCTDGCLDMLIQCDTLINRYSKLGVEKIDPVIRGILRLSVYQLKFMDRVPESAVCNEAVKLAKLHGLFGPSGFVNGVLRNMARDKAKASPKFFEFKEPEERYSLPASLFERLSREFGEKKACEISENYLRERPVQVRLCLSKLPEEEIRDILLREVPKLRKVDVEAVLRSSEESGFLLHSMPVLREMPVIYELPGIPGVEKLEAFKRGLIQVQDLSGAVAAAALCPEKGALVMDVCAAPGGKTIAVADFMAKSFGEEQRIISRDLTERKLSLIRENVTRCGFKNIRAEIWDALSFDPRYEKKIDSLIADLPCSGLGIAGKKPDIKLNVGEKEIEELSRLQSRMLDIVSRYVKPGGRLLYSTCTLTKEEDEDNALSFAERSGFRLLYMTKLLPAAEHDGFFISVFERPTE